MVNFKLKYFDGRGKAEIIRQLFAIAETPYEDYRVTKAEWVKLKDEVPFGQLPVLDIGETTVPQSFAICRYLARQFGYAGNSMFEQAVVDSIADQFKDYMNEVKPFCSVVEGFSTGDLAALKTTVFLPACEKFYGFIVKFLQKNYSGFLVGNSLTWADLYIAEHTAEYGAMFPEVLVEYPEIQAHCAKVRSHPALKQWIERRPKTKF